MFRGGQANPYDEIVVKTTDENLTSENWELILNLCDKVQEEGEQGARNVVAAALKRLAHRNPNVQLYTLTLVEALSKNCGIEVQREIASRAFTQGLEKLVTDRTTHDKVRKRVLGLVVIWSAEFEKDSALGMMDECYENLKSKGYKFETPDEPPPPEVDDDVRRREEEELQRVLELSMQDKGGRSQWESYSLASSGGAGGSGAGTSKQATVAAAMSSSSSSRPAPSSQPSQPPPTYGGYVPSSATPAVAAVESHESPATVPTVSSAPVTPSSPVSTHSAQDSTPIVTRVRALHAFEPSEPGELAFEKGDIIKVVDRNYKDWWRGQLKGRTGIFPVNYVEPLPEPTAAEIARGAEQEAAVFSQAANVDRLLMMLRNMDPAKDNLADNEEIQELYRSCMSLRPKIVKLIDKYSQKRADLVSMNETFVKARSIFDRMMEESLARHTGVYDGRPPYVQNPSQGYIVRPDSRAHQEYMPQTAPQMAPGGPQQYGWNPTLYDQPGYNAYPAAATAYPPGAESHYPGTQPPYGDPNAYAAHAQSPYGQHPPQGYPGQAPAPYGAPPAEQQGYPPTSQHQPPYTGAGPHPGPGNQHGAPLQPQSGLGSQAGYGPQPAHGTQPGAGPQVGAQVATDPAHGQPQLTAAPDYHAQGFPQPSGQPEAQPSALPDYHAHGFPQPGAQPEPQHQAYPGSQPGVQFEPQPQPQPQAQQQPPPQAQTQIEAQAQPEPQAQPHQQEPQQAAQQQLTQQQAAPTSQQSGPPYVFDPNATYPDPNVQAWAQYYAHGGTEPTGSVYFISVPGVKEDPAPAPVRTMSLDSTMSQDAAAATQTAPLSIHKVQPGEQPQQAAVTQSNVYGALPYAPTAASEEGAPATGQTYYGLEDQFAGIGISGGGPQNGQAPGPQGVGAPA
ncbi:hypothetical protein LXA43DRAFT_1000697 [Ganoderma leucocontextum]|nr:hypothetical protein LXA43DRAFT_1000697 [Ganoderma leucocontextum]